MNIPRTWRLTQHNYRLIGQVCPVCHHKMIPARLVCPQCHPADYETALAGANEQQESLILPLFALDLDATPAVQPAW